MVDVDPPSEPVATTRSVSIPRQILDRWQTVVDTMAELLSVPAGLIMCVVGDGIEVLVASRTAANPYRPGDAEPLFGSGLYCETVIKTGAHLLVPDALTSPIWQNNPDVRLGMVSYLGFPIAWPDGRPFGTICVLDNKHNAYNDVFKRLVQQFRDIIEHHLQLIYEDRARDLQMMDERKRQDEALRSNEERFRLIAEHAADDFFVNDDHGRILDANQRACENTGYTREQLLRMNVGDLPLDLGRGWSQSDWARFQPGDSLAIESEYRRPGADTILVEMRLSCHVVRDAKLFLWLVRDITRRVETERMLRTSEAALAEGQRISHTGTWRWNLDTGESSASAESFRIFGADPSGGTLSVEQYWGRIHPEDRPRVQKIVADAIAGNRHFSFETRLLMSDGTVKNLFTTGIPEADDKGGRWYFGTDMDITERRRTESALRHAETELGRVSRVTNMGQLAGAIVHEMNQPLAAVATSTEACLRWLDREQPDVAQARKAIANLVEASHRASDVMAGLRAMARKSTVEMASVDINEVAGEVLSLTRDELERAGVVVVTNLSTGERWIRGDRVQLQLVIHNLIRNAIDAMAEIADRPRQLILSTQDDQSGDVIVTVEDTGVGIQEETAARMFDSLFTTKANGMGMGLSICRSIIEAHGRSILASARPSGPGTRVSFALPPGR